MLNFLGVKNCPLECKHQRQTSPRWTATKRRSILGRWKVCSSLDLTPDLVVRFRGVYKNTPKLSEYNLRIVVFKRNLLFQGQIFWYHAKLQGVSFAGASHISKLHLYNTSYPTIIWYESLPKKQIRPYQIIKNLTMCMWHMLVFFTQNRHLWQFEVRWRPNLLGDAFMWRATSSWVSVGHEFREFRFAALAAGRAQGGWRRSVKIFPVKRILFRPTIMEVENDCIWKVATIGVTHV